MNPARPTPEDAEAMGKALVDLSWKKPPQVDDVRNLIESGADLNQRDHMNRCALSLAIGAQNIEIAKLLLEAGANPNNPDDLGRAPLYWAVGASASGIIQLLLDKGANINAQDRDGYTPLMDAAIGGKGIIAQLLVTRGAKLDIASAYGHTALTLACLNAKKDVDHGHGFIIRLLTDAGADPSLKNRDGKTCTDFLRERGHDELLAYIESAPARREAARPKIVVPKPDKAIKLKPKPPKP
jgi:ankyrin repeat protein